MTKQEFSDLLLLSIGIQNQDKRASYDDRVIWRLGDVVRGELIYAYQKDSQSKGEFTRGIVLPVENDSTRDRKYTKIGGNVLNMKDNSGFVSVSLVRGDTNPFAITSAGQTGIYQGLEAAEIGVTAWQEGERIYFNNLGFEVEEVLVIGIPTIAVLGDDENIPIPYGLESVWFDKVKEKLAGQVPEDKENDGRQSPE